MKVGMFTFGEIEDIENQYNNNIMIIFRNFRG